jgi:hypothetical protein
MLKQVQHDIEKCHSGIVPESQKESKWGIKTSSIMYMPTNKLNTVFYVGMTNGDGHLTLQNGEERLQETWKVTLLLSPEPLCASYSHSVYMAHYQPCPNR